MNYRFKTNSDIDAYGDTLFEQAKERVQNGIEYVAIVRHDDELLAKVVTHSLESLQEELYKLERAEQRKVEEEYNERIDDKAYMRDLENDIIATYNGDY